jgi:Tol biopolymer transport system component
VRSAIWLVVLAGCGRIDFDESAGDATSDATSARCAGPYAWSAPQRIPALETAGDDNGPAISPDNQTLVWSAAGTGQFELYIATRQGASWSTPATIPALMIAGCEATDPAWNAAGTRLYVSRNCANVHRLVSANYSGGSFGAVSLVAGLETVAASAPAVSSDELELFYTSFPGNGNLVGRATRAQLGDTWIDHGTETELGDSTTNPGWPSLSGDGRTVIIEATAGTQQQIQSAVRSAIGAPFGALTAVPEIFAAGVNDGDPDLAWDCESLYFVSSRAGGSGLNDLYVVTRTN